MCVCVYLYVHPGLSLGPLARCSPATVTLHGVGWMIDVFVQVCGVCVCIVVWENVCISQWVAGSSEKSVCVMCVCKREYLLQDTAGQE